MPEVTWEKGWTANSLSNEWKGAGRDLLRLCQAAAGIDHAFPQARQLSCEQDPGLRSAPRRLRDLAPPTGALSATAACCKAASRASGANTAKCATIAAPCRTARRFCGSPARRPSGPDGPFREPGMLLSDASHDENFNIHHRVQSGRQDRRRHRAASLWTDEIVVADSNSTDGTTKLAETHGRARGADSDHDLQRIAQPRRRRLQRRLDHQPRFRRALHAGIARRNPRVAGRRRRNTTPICIPRRNYFMGRWIKGSGWYPNYRQPQLYRKGTMRYTRADPRSL